MKTNYFFPWIVIALLFAVTAYSQKRRDSITSQAFRDSTTNKLVQRAGITSQKDEELKAIGVDLHDYVSRNSRGELLHDERCHAGLSDLVFIGKVLSIVDIPGPSDDPFHSKVNVLILEVLRGPKQQSDTIQLLRQGGGIITDVTPSKDALARVLQVPHVQ